MQANAIFRQPAPKSTAIFRFLPAKKDFVGDPSRNSEIFSLVSTRFHQKKFYRRPKGRPISSGLRSFASSRLAGIQLRFSFDSTRNSTGEPRWRYRKRGRFKKFR
jgi:hypothetical protein